MAQPNDMFLVGKKYLFSVDDNYHSGTITRIVGNDIEIKDVTFLIPKDEAITLLQKGLVPQKSSSLPNMIINRLVYETAILVTS